ncbi:hypothetical protein H5410_031226 [Solanum commersonii]|uniref:Uncharacterized protein n=1 Tax=Solanum commersonii TaxID=4109 RepID=A0A9J5YJL4_SOLCO|nr:hypothetical protein H5410_031226 [Solanum commersonii]
MKEAVGVSPNNSTEQLVQDDDEIHQRANRRLQIQNHPCVFCFPERDVAKPRPLDLWPKEWVNMRFCPRG